MWRDLINEAVLHWIKPVVYSSLLSVSMANFTWRAFPCFNYLKSLYKKRESNMRPAKYLLFTGTLWKVRKGSCSPNAHDLYDYIVIIRTPWMFAYLGWALPRKLPWLFYFTLKLSMQFDKWLTAKDSGFLFFFKLSFAQLSFLDLCCHCHTDGKSQSCGEICQNDSSPLKKKMQVTRIWKVTAIPITVCKIYFSISAISSL